MASKTKVIRVKSWNELPDILKPGTYVIKGRRVRVYREVDKETLMRDLRRKLPSGRYI